MAGRITNKDAGALANAYDQMLQDPSVKWPAPVYVPIISEIFGYTRGVPIEELTVPNGGTKGAHVVASHDDAPRPRKQANPQTAINKSAQAWLNDHGFEAGSVDGKAGEKTLTALDAFRKENGLEDRVGKKPNSKDLEAMRALDIEQTKEAQQWLNDHGFNVGDVDGKAGKKTQKALDDFRKANGLEDVAGKPLSAKDREKMKALGTAQPEQAPETPATPAPATAATEQAATTPPAPAVDRPDVIMTAFKTLSGELNNGRTNDDAEALQTIKRMMNSNGVAFMGTDENTDIAAGSYLKGDQSRAFQAAVATLSEQDITRETLAKLAQDIEGGVVAARSTPEPAPKPAAPQR